MPLRPYWLPVALTLGLLLAPSIAHAQADAAPDAAPAEGHAGIDARHYDFALTLHEETDRIDGVARVRVRFLEDEVDTLALDLVGKEGGEDGATGMQVKSVTWRGNARGFVHEDDRLRLSTGPTPDAGEERTYRIRYAGVPADGLIISENQFGDRTFFGDNWPIRARHWLPAVDHPADKATVAFDVTAPDAYQVVANGRLEERTDLPGPTSVTRYRTRAPLPMKVTVIGAARFATGYPGTVRTAGGDVPLESWVYPQSRDAGFEQMAQAGRIVRYFSEKIGPFPFEKLANVESKTRYGGMENAGAIFYSERAVAEGTDIEPLLAHEIAHQWFGDAVTEASYAHLWLSEGFATYLTDLFIEEVYGPERFRERMRGERESVARFAEQNPQTSLVNRRYDEATELLNPFSYQKGAWVLHMLRRKIGNEAFWSGLRRYYDQYRGGNADTRDFRQAMEATSGTDLAGFFEQWTEGPALPRYEGVWRYDEGRLEVELRQATPGDFVFEQPLELGIYAEGGDDPRIETLDVNARQETFAFELDAPPARVELDPDANALMTATFERE
jgi:aminopeptidase N